MRPSLKTLFATVVLGFAADGSASAQSPTQTAPVLNVNGQSLNWNQVGGVSTYVFVKKVPGSPDAYSQVRGTSTTPSPAPGATVRYSVRTDVAGSLWAKERSITYAGSAAAPSRPVAPATPPASSGFTAGVTAGSALDYELPFVRSVGARSARLSFSIGAAVRDMAPVIGRYAQAGIKPLLLATFDGRTPSQSEARNLATWAAAFGSGGSFWAGTSYPASVAVSRIEFGNESSQSYQYSTTRTDPNWANTSYYKNLAFQYGLRFKDAATAIAGANPRVGLLAAGDVPGNWRTWMDGIFSAVPNFRDYVAGWTVHPYGSSWATKLDNTLAQSSSHGAGNVPVYATEYGVSSDDGRCLNDNYGWDRCASYETAASVLSSSLSAMRARYGSRLAAVYLYQAHDQLKHAASGSREGYYGVLKQDGSAKRSYTTAAKAFLAG